MSDGDDEVLAALGQLATVLRSVSDDAKALARRTENLRRDRLKGTSYSELTAMEERPLIVEHIRDLSDELTRAGAVLRRAEARALHDEGMTMDRIAELFGVTRQRISALVNASRHGS